MQRLLFRNHGENMVKFQIFQHGLQNRFPISCYVSDVPAMAKKRRPRTCSKHLGSKKNRHLDLTTESSLPDYVSYEDIIYILGN